MKLSKAWRYLFMFVSALFVTAYLSACASLGYKPSDNKLVQIQKSPNYSLERSQFINYDQASVDQRSTRPRSLSFIWDSLMNRDRGAPVIELPHVEPDFSEFLSEDKELKVIWFGHSSFLLNIDGNIVLVDPVFGSADPLGFFVERFQQAAADISELPKIDYILISHDHYDHLEMDTIEYFSQKDVTFVVPLGVSSHLIGWGVNPEKIVEKDWWQSTEFADVKFTAVPSQHFSGREAPHQNTTLWASWVIQTENSKVFFSGDTGYHDQFEVIGEKYGPFDVAFMETGQYFSLWKEVHLFPEQAIKAYKELQAQSYFPIHWGVFKLAPHAWDDSIKEITSLAQQNQIPMFAPKMGEVIDLQKPKPVEPWWETIATTGAE